jgi:CHASE2 domain-containing sensor protein
MGAVGVTPMGEAQSSRWMPGVACMALAAMFALAAVGSGASARLDAMLYDAATAAARAAAPAPAEGVVLVGIDQTTVDSIAAPIALWHSQLGAALGAMAKGGPRLIALDVVLPEKSMNAFDPGLDLALLKGIVSARTVNPAGGIVLALQPDAAGGLRAIYPPYVAAAGEQGVGAAAFRIEVDGAVRFVDPEISTFTAAIAQRLERPTPAGYIDYTYRWSRSCSAAGPRTRHGWCSSSLTRLSSSVACCRCWIDGNSPSLSRPGSPSMSSHPPR